MIANRFCLECNSSRLLCSGSREGSLWCFVFRKAVAPLSQCQWFSPYQRLSEAQNAHPVEPLDKAAPCLVKSAAKCQIGTDFQESPGL